MTFQELEAEICMFEEQSDLGEDTNEYISMDEPVLLELQNLTQQVKNLEYQKIPVEVVFITT